MAIGGRSQNRYIAYVTLDNEEFFNLVFDSNAKGSVLLFIGGQEGKYPAETLVDVELGMKAAKVFVERGEIEPNLQRKT